MKIHTRVNKTINTIRTPIIVIPMFEDAISANGNTPTVLKELVSLKNPIRHNFKQKVFSGKAKQIFMLQAPVEYKADNIVVLGLGKKDKLNYIVIREALAEVSRFIVQKKYDNFSIQINDEIFQIFDPGKIAQAITEGILLGTYEFTDFKSVSEDEVFVELNEVIIEVEQDYSGLTNGIQKGKKIADSVNFARDLANTPANHLTPRFFVNTAIKKFKKSRDINLTIINKAKAKSLGMGALLGVAQGSANDPYVLVIEYTGTTDEAPICLVGKGVTFDSGGISIKPAAGMSEMKADMSGGAATAAALLALSKLRPSKNITAIIPLVENMPSGTAQRPGDIVKAMNGKTIEIINTDAEGRLILADALCYAQTLKPSCIIDVATLTGACLVALGTQAAAILGNNQDLIEKIKTVAEFTGERVWQLPLYDEYLEQLKSDIADINHCYEGREGGTCTAAKFLEQFVDEIPWVHFDIASVMSYKAASGSKVKGMSGESVRNLIEFCLAY